MTEYRPALPPIERIEVNKNYLDLSTSKYSERFQDDRSLWVRFKLRHNLEPKKQDFGALFDRYFGPSNSEMNRIFPGELACSIAHISIWRKLRDCDDDLCLVLEDDARLLPGLDASHFTWPRDAHLLHLHPHSLYNYTKDDGDGRFGMMTSRPKESPLSNMLTIGYAITPAGARVLLDNLLPMPIDEPIDFAMFDQLPAEFRPYLSCRNMIRVLPYRSIVRHSRFEMLLTALKESLVGSVLQRVWRLFATKALKRFVGRHISR